MRFRNPLQRFGAGTKAGDLLVHRALGSRATYCVLSSTRSFVRLRVIAAPGLAPGTGVQFRLKDARGIQRAAARLGVGADARGAVAPPTMVARW